MEFRTVTVELDGSDDKALSFTRPLSQFHPPLMLTQPLFLTPIFVEICTRVSQMKTVKLR
jgi:hypothetical protein